MNSPTRRYNQQEYGNIQNLTLIIQFFTKKRGTSEFEEYKGKYLSDFILYSNIIMQSQYKQDLINLLLSSGEDLLRPIFQFLLDSKSQIRSQAIKILRILMSKEMIEFYLKQNIHIFIGNCLERDRKDQEHNQVTLNQDQIECFKLIRAWINLSPQNFPKFLAGSLVALSESSDESLKRHSIRFLSDLVSENPLVCAWSGGIRVLIDAITDPFHHETSDQIVFTLVTFLNDNNLRDQVWHHLDFSRIFSIFSDVESIENRPKDKKKINIQDLEKRLELGKNAIVQILKTFNGLIFLGHEQKCIKSLIMSLKQPIDKKIRTVIFEIIGEIFSIGLKQPQESYNPNEVIMQDLFNIYLVIVLQLFLDNGLYKVLLELTGLDDQDISGLAQKYLKQLSYLNHTLLPNSQDYSKFLMVAASQDDDFYIGRANVTGIVNIMGNYLFEPESSQKIQNSLFFYQCESLHMSTPLTLPKYNINNETIIKLKSQIEQDISDTKYKNLLQSSGVLHSKKQQDWNWYIIQDIIGSCLMNSKQKLIDAINTRFIRRVLGFFRPSKQEFIKLDWVPEHFKYIQIGYLLIKLLLKYSEGRNELISSVAGVLKVQESFVTEIAVLFNEIENQFIDLEQCNTTMFREYITFVGLMSHTQKGLQLLQETGIFDSLNQMITKEYDHVLTLVIFSLDYSKDKVTRNFLSNCFQHGSISLIQAGIQLIHLLFKNELVDFNQWAIELLLQLLDKDEIIQMQVLEMLEEIAIIPEYTEIIISYFDKIYKLGSKSRHFFLKMLVIDEAFDKLLTMDNWIEKQMNYWKEQGNYVMLGDSDYYYQIEQIILKAFKNMGNDTVVSHFNIPELMVNQECSYLACGFIQRMPWSITVNYSLSNDYQSIQNISLKSSILMKNHQMILSGFVQNQTQIAFKREGQFKLNLQLAIGKIYIDNNCLKQDQPYYITCDHKDKQYYEKIQDGKLIIAIKGAVFLFNFTDEMIYLDSIKIYFNLSQKKQGFDLLPINLLNQLSQTQKGISLLQQTKYIDSLISDLADPRQLITKKGSLWALGFLGLSPGGNKLLQEKQFVKQLIKLAQNSELLSLRGLCLYVINFIGQTQEGRRELELEKWYCQRSATGKFLALPKNLNKFFEIKIDNVKSKLGYWPLQEAYWAEFKEMIGKLNLSDDALALVQGFQKMSNILESNDAKQEIQNTIKANSKLLLNVHVFYGVMLSMTFFKFIGNVRKYIYSSFEKLMQPQSRVFFELDQTEDAEVFKKHII